ncbi:dynamin family protein [Merismopedia glauca]|uniref:Dynamin n=1 Tax=Merismopedia glauca CCAP 1448/3 TaxID=1296344 RepID=A0A2T1C353_9CYAN|nr:dynamin family protein [Merismopedia glauca]PSB02700.1 dynamin [Merismopedia glauca CCAP 1448/3]
MISPVESTVFLDHLELVNRGRSLVASLLESMADRVKFAEDSTKRNSGQLGLVREIEDLDRVSDKLKKGVFRLLVLGDMKRGKSTFLNALIGEKVLPSDVNPCTAILTVLRYGTTKKVTVYFSDRRSPEELDFQEFKLKYTIDPSEAKQLEQENKSAFPNVDYAVVEYPLPLLAKGVEIVDSPGLNDTEARNELSLGYVNNCHAILFVLAASQPCTLAERRYLENYIKDRGLSVFFLINAWDRVRESLIDPDDTEELELAETRLRQVFANNLAEYCRVDGYNLYEERVFEVSSLQALRKRLKNPDALLEGTGFPEFIKALNTFLTKERGIAELREGRTIARQITHRIQEAIARRIPLLDTDVNELKKRINSVTPEFEQLTEIRDRFQSEIVRSRDTKSQAIAESFRTYTLNLGNTFEADFLKYQPELKLLDFLSQGKREAFNAAMQKAFEQYINDKLADWSRSAEQEMKTAFSQLSQTAAKYGSSYNQITDRITEKLTGQQVPTNINSTTEDNSPGWAKWAMGLFSLSTGNIAGMALAGAGFDWKSILLNYFTVVGLGSIIAAVFPVALFAGPIGLGLLGLGVGVFQADRSRHEVVKLAKQELVKHLPRLAQEQSKTVFNAVQECFNVYEREVTKRINEDIQSRQSELDNLLAQKSSFEIDRQTEIERLQKLETEVSGKLKEVENIYQDCISSLS